MKRVQKKKKTDHMFPKGIVLKMSRKKIWIYKVYDSEQHIFLVFTVPFHSYQQDIVKEKWFLVLCSYEFCLFLWMICTDTFPLCSSVLLLQLHSRHSELVHSQFESSSSLLVLPGCRSWSRSFIVGQSIRAGAFCFQMLYWSNTSWTFYKLKLDFELWEHI